MKGSAGVRRSGVLEVPVLCLKALRGHEFFALSFTLQTTETNRICYFFVSFEDESLNLNGLNSLRKKQLPVLLLFTCFQLFLTVNMLAAKYEHFSQFSSAGFYLEIKKKPWV